MENSNHYDAIVIGGGPAGLTAGIYLSRARLKTLILNEGTIGGQMVLTHEIANYPGVESVNGYQLSNIMKKQAMSFGCTIKANILIADIHLSGKEKVITLSDGTRFVAEAVILSPGGRSRTLGVEGESHFKGRGISYCATCDGDFFTDKEIVVVGGGNSALEEAVALTKYASKVTVVHQFDEFQAFEHAIEEARTNDKVNFIMTSKITAFRGDENLKSVDITNIQTGAVSDFKTDGVFIFIGYVPNTEFLKGKIELNQWGEMIVANDMSTSVAGVFGAGDSVAKRFRQVTTAVADGTVAALAASQYLHQLKAGKNARPSLVSN
ncbi:NAD(P)/FAD-dependent oxidoreductase [Geofilum sp. OHC36d9]|uniref:NAD(P)/FAD-dependent oxidoreductase n=1 Tax=Geofilum sp. OHC36d9 TaxID=3458413 RepID=UPI00403476A7